MVSTDNLVHGIGMLTPVVELMTKILNWGVGFITVKNMLFGLGIYAIFYFWQKAEKDARKYQFKRRL